MSDASRVDVRVFSVVENDYLSGVYYTLHTYGVDAFYDQYRPNLRQHIRHAPIVIPVNMYHTLPRNECMANCLKQASQVFLTEHATQFRSPAVVEIYYLLEGGVYGTSAQIAPHGFTVHVTRHTITHQWRAVASLRPPLPRTYYQGIKVDLEALIVTVDWALENGWEPPTIPPLEAKPQLSTADLAEWLHTPDALMLPLPYLKVLRGWYQRISRECREDPNPRCRIH